MERIGFRNNDFAAYALRDWNIPHRLHGAGLASSGDDIPYMKPVWRLLSGIGGQTQKVPLITISRIAPFALVDYGFCATIVYTNTITFGCYNPFKFFKSPPCSSSSSSCLFYFLRQDQVWVASTDFGEEKCGSCVACQPPFHSIPISMMQELTGAPNTTPEDRQHNTNG